MGGYNTDTKSTALKDREARLAFLFKYFITLSKVDDAAYHIVYQDNSKEEGRPFDYELWAAFKVEARDFSLWTKNMKKILPQ